MCSGVNPKFFLDDRAQAFTQRRGAWYLVIALQLVHQRPRLFLLSTGDASGLLRVLPLGFPGSRATLLALQAVNDLLSFLVRQGLNGAFPGHGRHHGMEIIVIVAPFHNAQGVPDGIDFFDLLRIDGGHVNPPTSRPRCRP